MNAAMITALCTGIPSVIGAITALIYAVKAKGAVNNHVAQAHNGVGNAVCVTKPGFDYTTKESPNAPT